MRALSLYLLLLLTPFVHADNAANYRDDFIKTCHDDDDGQSQTLCQCVFDTWLDQLPSKTDSSAITAAKLLANVEGDYYPSDMQKAAIYMQDIQNISMQCLDKYMGAIHLGGDSRNADPSNENSSNTTVNAKAQAEDTQGLLGALVGWAGQQAGLPDAVTDAVVDQTDVNDQTIRNKLSRFNPFKKGDGE